VTDGFGPKQAGEPVVMIPMRSAMRTSLTTAVLLAAAWLMVLIPAGAQDTPSPTTASPTTASPTTDSDNNPFADSDIWNWQLSTYGGKQFWTDQTILAGWRIQLNVVTGHYRLLDPEDVRHEWGTQAACEAKLAEIAREKNLQPPRGKVVITMHGLLRSRSQLDGLAKFLREEGGYEVINFGYASSRSEVGEHAEALARVVDHCGEAKEINFVAHSLGNIVLRHYLGDCETGAHGQKLNPKIKRIVMLGPPNNGAEMAKRFAENNLFKMVWGKSGQQLADRWGALQPKLCTPPCEFGIIAGASGTDIGWNPLVTGDDDMVVGVNETKLGGATDFLTLKVIHGEMMDNAAVRKATLNYLQQGYFISAAQRHPLPADPPREEVAGERMIVHER
jgi:hypothetical protein